MLGQLIAVGNIPSARQELDTLLNTKRTVSLRLKEVYLLRLEGNLPLAMQVVESILVDSPSSSRAHMLRGILFFDQENYEAAVTDLKSVLESEPYNKETHYKLGQAYRNLGRENQATQHFRKSRELTEATIRIAELESQLSSDPKNNNLRSELASDPKFLKPLEQLLETELPASIERKARDSVLLIRAAGNVPDQAEDDRLAALRELGEIGRASCRERV